MKTINLVTLLLVAIPTFLFGQEFTPIVQSNILNDSSFYDIKKMTANSFWVGGEKGILFEINSVFEKKYIPYPNQGVNILKIDKFSENHYVLCADQGTIYHYFKNENRWEIQHLRGFKGKVIYNFAALNDKIAYICGGNSKIAASKKAIPNGFIYKTEDGGFTWKKVYKSIGSMIWDLDVIDKKVIALKYNIRGSRLITLSNQKNKVESKGKLYKLLAHEYNADLKMLVGANDFHIYNSGKIINCSNNSEINFKNLVWDITSFNSLKIGSSCSGKIVLINHNGTLKQEIQCPSKFNLYGIISVNDNSLLIIGSNKTILKLQLNKTDIQKLNN
ncbi:MAG: hypothetical protein RL065_511 [Bacteroidota bacterium]